MHKSPKSINASSHYVTNNDYLSAAGKSHNRANSDNEGDSGSIQRKKILWKENPLKPKPKPLKEGKIIDWLREQRIKHDQERSLGGSVTSKPNKDWKKELERMDLHGKEKYDIVLDKARLFEEKAKRKQDLIGVTKGATIEDIVELNDMYVESIKAKLELLNDFN